MWLPKNASDAERSQGCDSTQLAPASSRPLTPHLLRLVPPQRTWGERLPGSWLPGTHTAASGFLSTRGRSGSTGPCLLATSRVPSHLSLNDLNCSTGRTVTNTQTQHFSRPEAVSVLLPIMLRKWMPDRLTCQNDLWGHGKVSVWKSSKYPPC